MGMGYLFPGKKVSRLWRRGTRSSGGGGQPQGRVLAVGDVLLAAPACAASGQRLAGAAPRAGIRHHRPPRYQHPTEKVDLTPQSSVEIVVSCRFPPLSPLSPPDLLFVDPFLSS